MTSTTDRTNQHNVADWCLRYTGPKLGTSQICDVAEQLGLGIDLPPQEEWPEIRKRGIRIPCALPPMPGGKKPYELGFCDPSAWDAVEQAVGACIDAAADAGIPRVLVFTGFHGSIPRLNALTNCVDGFTRATVKRAEEKKIVLVLEYLNTAGVDKEMTGHPGYLGDNLDEVAGIVRKINSPFLRLALDLYHVRMAGLQHSPAAAIARYRDVTDYIHTAGFHENPAETRCELNAPGQGIEYPGAMRMLKRTGYKGDVTHEFLFRMPDHAGSLRTAVEVCEPEDV